MRTGNWRGVSGRALPGWAWGAVFCMVAAETGCAARALPHDPAAARYVLDVMPQTWCYADAPLHVRTDFDCWSAAGSKRMRFPAGRYVYEYTLAPNQGEPVVLKQWLARPVQWSGDLKTLPGAPKRLAAGKYKLTIAATLPSGKVVAGSFVRDVEVRRRELAATLTADRSKYAIGETIVLTGSLKNVQGADLDLSDVRKLDVAIEAWEHGERMPVGGVRLPKSLRASASHRLFELRFKAGEEDQRFTMGRRIRLTPLPFRRTGKYRPRLLVSVLAGLKAQGPKRVERSMRAAPAVAAFEIVRGGKQRQAQPGGRR